MTPLEEKSTKDMARVAEPVKVTDAPDFQIDVKYVAKFLAMEPQDVPRLSPKHIPRPSRSGVYPCMRTIEAMFRYLRRQREEIGRDELSELCGVAGPRINQLAKEGVVHQIRHGVFDRPLSLTGIFKWMRGRIGQGETSQAKIRANGAELQNRLLEIQVKRAEGDALDRRDVEKAWTDRLLVTREQFLTLPSKFATRVPYLKNEVEAEKELRQLVEEILQNAARPIDYESNTESE